MKWASSRAGSSFGLGAGGNRRNPPAERASAGTAPEQGQKAGSGQAQPEGLVQGR